MTDAELGMELYVVIGNALHLLLRGGPAILCTQNGIDRQQLERLDCALSPVAPNQMLAMVRGLAGDDRSALSACCLCCVAYAGSEAEAVLGAPPELVRELANRLLALH